LEIGEYLEDMEMRALDVLVYDKIDFLCDKLKAMDSSGKFSGNFTSILMGLQYLNPNNKEAFSPIYNVILDKIYNNGDIEGSVLNKLNQQNLGLMSNLVKW